MKFVIKFMRFDSLIDKSNLSKKNDKSNYFHLNMFPFKWS